MDIEPSTYPSDTIYAEEESSWSFLQMDQDNDDVRSMISPC
jgi:hypothetical protein